MAGGIGRDKPPATGCPDADHDAFGFWPAAFCQDGSGCCRGVFWPGGGCHAALGFCGMPAPAGGAIEGFAWLAADEAFVRGSTGAAAVGAGALLGGS